MHKPLSFLSLHYGLLLPVQPHAIYQAVNHLPASEFPNLERRAPVGQRSAHVSPFIGYKPKLLKSAA